MQRARFRFYAELNDFLPAHRRAVSFEHAFLITSVKDAIESLGVPHTEVDLILANGQSVDFAYRVRDGDRISVYPMFEALDIRPLNRVRPEPLRQPRFVLDTHLGRLANYLRMLGFDTLYDRHCHDAELARISAGERRILLTRDRGLLKRGTITHGYCLRETNPRRQLVEVLRRFDLGGSIAPFERCLRCNGKLGPVSAELRACPGCGRVYWKGSHYARMQQFIRRVIEEAYGQASTSAGGARVEGGADPEAGSA